MMDQRARIEIDTAALAAGWKIRFLDGKTGNEVEYSREIPSVGGVSVLVRRHPEGKAQPVRSEVVVVVAGNKTATHSFGDDTDAFFFVGEQCRKWAGQ